MRVSVSVTCDTEGGNRPPCLSAAVRTQGRGPQALDYVKVGDYYLPDLTAEPYPDRGLGKYGLLRLRYLKEHRPIVWAELVMEGKLYAHLLEVEDAAHNLLDSMMPGMAKEAGATEDLKVCDPMRWVGLMNCCKAQVEEIIFADMIYS